MERTRTKEVVWARLGVFATCSHSLLLEPVLWQNYDHSKRSGFHQKNRENTTTIAAKRGVYGKIEC